MPNNTFFKGQTMTNLEFYEVCTVLGLETTDCDDRDFGHGIIIEGRDPDNDDCVVIWGDHKIKWVAE